MKRLVVALLLLGGMTSASGQSSISITSMDSASVPTFGLIAINGNGFDTSASISIVFTARDAITVTVPAVSATSAAVRVAAPALVSSRSGQLFDIPVVVEVQVVQVTTGSVMTSNTLGGLTIEPAAPVAGPAGAFTKSFAQTNIDIMSDLRTARQSTAGYGDVLTMAQAFTDAQRTIIDAINLILANKDVTVNLPTKDSLPMLLDSNVLATTDRLASAYIQQANAAARRAGGSTAGGCGCTGTTDAERMLCEFRHNACLAYDASRRVAPELALDSYGAALGLLGGWSAGGFSSAGSTASESTSGLGFLASQALAYVTSILAGTAPPQVGSLFQSSAQSMIDDFTANGLGVLPGLDATMQMTQSVGNVVYHDQAIQVGPIGNMAIAAPQPENPPSNTRPMRIYYGTGVGPKWIATPINQSVTTLAQQTLPAPRVARFNGSYAGSTTGTCVVQTPDGPFVSGGSGPISASVLNGVISGDGGGTGTVTETGRFITPTVGAGGITCSAGGLFWTDGNSAGATGYVSCAGAGVGCAGTWNLARQ